MPRRQTLRHRHSEGRPLATGRKLVSLVVFEKYSHSRRGPGILALVSRGSVLSAQSQPPTPSEG